jgi:ABC-type bacteriocin/lantibiotic exporter with double-glycine peptidase domain
MSSRKSKIKKNFHRQHDQSDCGVACLQSVISFYGGTKSLEHLRELSGTSKQGTTLLGLYQAAQKCGFQAQGLESGLEWLKTIEQPVILHVVVDKYLQHYLVCYGYENGQFAIGDPAKGITTFSEEELNKIWQSKALLKLKPTGDFEKTKDIRRGKYSWFRELIKEDSGLLSIIFFLSLIISILGMTMAIYSQKLIDEILPAGDIGKIVIGTGLLLVLLTARSGISYLAGFFGIKQGKDYNNRLINHFFGSLLYLPKSFFDNRRIGELTARMNDTSRIQSTITNVVGELLNNLLLILVGLVVLFFYSKIIGIVVLMSIPLFGLISWWYHKSIVSSQHEVMAANAHKSSNYVNTMQGIDSVKAYNREELFADINKRVYGHFQDKVFHLGKTGIRLQMAAEIFGVIITVAVLGAGSWLVVEEKLSIGSLMAVLGISGSIFPAITSLAFANITLQGAKVAFDRMYEFTSIKPEFISDNLEEEKNSFQFEKLEIQNLSFRFPGRKPILSNVSFSLFKGQSISILGESGGGKTTLLNILQGFYIQGNGSIQFNDQNINKIKLSLLRKSIGVVPQEIAIFNGTLFDNLLLGGSEQDIKHTLAFCKQAGFDRYFSKFPQGYATILGEEGINISGGQKQLIGLCRALLKAPSLLLLDEPTSAMDRETENFALRLLHDYNPQCGIILVTHQLKIANTTDCIQIIQDGRIRAFGKKEELLQFDNLYSRMYEELKLDFAIA